MSTKTKTTFLSMAVLLWPLIAGVSAIFIAEGKTTQRIETLDRDLSSYRADIAAIKKDMALTREDVAYIKGSMENLRRASARTGE